MIGPEMVLFSMFGKGGEMLVTGIGCVIIGSPGVAAWGGQAPIMGPNVGYWTFHGGTDGAVQLASSTAE